MVGVKYDNGKSRVDLLPALGLLEVGHVLAVGAAVYGDNNWRAVVGAKRRYIAAALRHVFRYMAGEDIDPETGRHHLAHAACDVLFVLELELEEQHEANRGDKGEPHITDKEDRDHSSDGVRY